MKLAAFFGIFGLAISVCPQRATALDAEAWHIDQGFIGRPVSLDILGGQARLSWKSGDVLFPSDIDVSVASSTVDIRWSTSYALGPKGIEIGVRPELFSATTSDPWQELALEAKAPFGAWRKLDSKLVDGYVVARIGAEAQVRLTAAPRGMRSGTATWYKYKACPCAASPDFPKGTRLKVSLADDPTKSIVVKVNDWGPDRRLFPNRVIDLDSTAFKKLAPLSRGKIEVRVEPVGAPSAALTQK